ncbi:RNA polymerase sigma factor [Sphingomonas sp. Leaf339]|uniref:RNA polymerase sigma factor n=1 Tax=Sphingomonas sp. Leaf339 TaxID=1736343 RepID=UPI000A99F2A4|nr:sigma-70 family RNA polymerase sigma factor [Sphingomonas sp. Leaf339]
MLGLYASIDMERGAGGPARTDEMRQGFTQHLGAIRRFFLKRAPVADVDDLVQDVAMRMHTRRADDPIANVEGYLFQTAHSVLADRGRRDSTRCRSSHDSLEEFHHPVEDRSPERVLEGKEQWSMLLAAMEDLPARTREAFVLHRFEEMQYAAIAGHMGISVSAVEKHIMRAIRRLADAIA